MNAKMTQNVQKLLSKIDNDLRLMYFRKCLIISVETLAFTHFDLNETDLENSNRGTITIKKKLVENSSHFNFYSVFSQTSQQTESKC